MLDLIDSAYRDILDKYSKWKLLVKFSDGNTTINYNSSKRNIDDQVKTNREEEHGEYFHEAGWKSSSLQNNNNNKNSKECDNFQERYVDKNQPMETKNQSLGQSGTCFIVGDSTVNCKDEKVFSKKHGSFSLSRTKNWGLKIEDVNQYVIRIIKKQPDHLMLDVGTNDPATMKL